MSDQETYNEEAARAFAKALFGPDDEQTDETDETDDTEPKPPSGNYVPLEGNVPKAKDNSDEQFVRILFDN